MVLFNASEKLGQLDTGNQVKKRARSELPLFIVAQPQWEILNFISLLVYHSDSLS